MKSIIPLTYKIKLFKDWIETKINDYKTPDYLKKAIEDLLFFSENLNLKKFQNRKIDGKKIWSYSPIEIEKIKDKTYVFINFKYWDEVNEHDNAVIVENEQIKQTLSKTWDLLADFPCAIDFNIAEDSKFLIIEWKMTIMSNWNQQMKSKILTIFKKIYIQSKNVWLTEPEYKVDFFITEEEIKIIDKRVSAIVLNYEIPYNNIYKWIAENTKSNKNAKIKIEFSSFLKTINEEKELEKFIKSLENLNWLQVWKLVSKHVKIRQNNKDFKWFLTEQNEEFIVQAKELFLENKKDISLKEFKEKSREYFE